MINFARIANAVSANLPSILTGMALAGVVSTTIECGRASVKASKTLEKLHYESEEEPTKMDKVKAVYKYYIPTVSLGLATMACVIGSHSINMRRQIALASAYSLSEKALKEFQDKTIEEIGQDKVKKIKDKIAEDIVGKNPPPDDDSIFKTNRGSTLCYDSYTETYFRSDVESIRAAEMAMNQKIKHSMYISLNEFRTTLGLNPIHIGDDVGWRLAEYEGFNPEDGDKIVDISFSYTGSPNGEPVLVLYYFIEPKHGYDL